MSKPSILQEKKECWICGDSGEYRLHLHHIYSGTGNRKVSDDNGFVVYLCFKHHNQSGYSVHSNDDMNKMLKKTCQLKFESMGNSREQFIKLIGKSYLED